MFPQAEGDEGTAVFRHQGSKGREDLNPDSPVRADILLRRLRLRKGSALALRCTGASSPLDGTPVSTQRRRAAPSVAVDGRGGGTRVLVLSPQVDAEQYYSELEEKWTDEFNAEKNRVPMKRLGVAFVTFRDERMTAV